jgi:hypothetical protein
MPTSRASLLAAWEKLQAGLEANQDELQLVDLYRQQLDAELAGLQTCQSRRSDLQIESRQATRDLKTSFARTRDLVNVLRAGLLLSYGPNSDKLLDFGLKPARKRRSGKEEGTPWKPAATE